ncbi:MAG: hypothetical protein MZU91_14725 [Desulfosudis oleivorans]|nr:hypothetical protein [Desulfosudis oleivorans]
MGDIVFADDGRADGGGRRTPAAGAERHPGRGGELHRRTDLALADGGRGEFRLLPACGGDLRQ